MENELTSKSTLTNPFTEAPDGKKRLILFAIFVAILGSMMQSSTLSTMLPMAAGEIGGKDYYSLASTIGAPLSIAAMPLWGYIAARSPHLKVPLFMVSMAAGVVTMVLRLFAPSMAMVIVAMVFWGFVSPGIFVVGYALIRDMYDAQKAGVYLGVCSTLMMIAMIAGPVGAGALMTYVGWRSLNILILPFMVLALVLPIFGVKVTKEQAAHLAYGGGAFDILGTVALTIGLGGLILYLSMGTSLLPFLSLGSNVLLAVTIAALALMVGVIIKKKESAIIPTQALRNRNVLAFTAANFCANFSNMAAFFFPAELHYLRAWRNRHGLGSRYGLLLSRRRVLGSHCRQGHRKVGKRKTDAVRLSCAKSSGLAVVDSGFDELPDRSCPYGHDARGGSVQQPSRRVL